MTVTFTGTDGGDVNAESASVYRDVVEAVGRGTVGGEVGGSERRGWSAGGGGLVDGDRAEIAISRDGDARGVCYLTGEGDGIGARFQRKKIPRRGAAMACKSR